jgi:hypothetical protein
VASRVVKSSRGYEIKENIGIAENTKPVDNDAYVNMTATRVLREAVAFAKRLNRSYPKEWEEIGRCIVLPVDEQRGYIKNHDAYSAEEKGIVAATPEALAGFFPWNYRVDPALERRTIEFYLGRAQEFVGGPMLSALLGVWAAWNGDRQASLRWFEEGYASFVEAPYAETNEFSRSKHPEKPRVGPFMANLGGFLMGCVYGLTGLELSDAEPANWFKRPVVLPQGWEGIEVDKLYVRGKPARLAAHQGDTRATLEF